MTTPSIRPETPADTAIVYAINAAAFDTDAEARLVDALRAHGKAVLSLVAEVEGVVVGHILFSPVTVNGIPSSVLGLAPVAVSPSLQRNGIGGALVREGLARVRALGHTAVVLLGHPDYYPRFGFVPALRFGLRCEYDCPDEAFMAIELVPDAFALVAGLVQYSAEFAEV